MNIAFCINRLALIGLGVTVSSLIRNCSDSQQLTLWFLCAGLRNEDKSNIEQLLASEGFRGNQHYIDFDPIAQFGNLRSLHGDWTTYGRLLLPELLTNVDSVLYLDADLVIELDVLNLVGFDLKDNALAAVPGATIKYALENDFLIKKCNLSLEDSYFNAGILLMNLFLWRKQNIKEQCLGLGKQYPNELLAVDQTILNALFSKTFASLPKAYNCVWYPDRLRPDVADKMILHYVGSPKPWDVGGKHLHKGFATWNTYLNSKWSKEYANLTISDFSRAWKIRNSYLRLIKKRILS